MFIFMLDKNPMVTTVLNEYFRQEGQRFYFMDKLTEAAFFIEDMRPDVLLLDDQYFTQDCSEFLASWQSSEFLRRLPVIVVGNGTIPTAINSLGRLPRPLEMWGLLEQIKKMMHQH